jgi:hypothetical protein
LGGFLVGGFDLEGEVSGVGSDAFEVDSVLHGFGPWVGVVRTWVYCSWGLITVGRTCVSCNFLVTR